MTSAVERLDYTKAPPGYRLVRDVDGFLFIDAGGKRHASAMHNLGGDWREDFALGRAWAHYKREHDPPGMFVNVWVPTGPLPPGCQWGVHGMAGILGIELEADARAAAWAWHDRRLALAVRLEGEGVQLNIWPAALAWTDDECCECEVWLGMRATPDDFPAVARADLAEGDKPEVESALARLTEVLG